jgi:predicted ATPase
VADATGSVHGFPASLTSFVGRAQAATEIAAQLAQYRLVTLTGPGGAGKTRLAGEVARRVAGRFADGVWLAELAAVRDPAQVPSAVAAALGIHDLPVIAAADALARALARRQLLLVLDNCEQVIGAAAEVCGRLLLGADDVRVLATSREPLRIAGEVRYRLGPLTLPAAENLANRPNPETAAESEAVTLFADRARRVDPGFTLDNTTGPTVAQLVARLDGMPLAIELAAARVDALGVPQLLDRIDDRFALLVDGDRLAQQRQRSLAAAVQWSYELLDAEEQRVFRAVSVFPGPFTLDGAEAVAGPVAGQTVPRLVDCSLLVPPRAGPTAEPVTRCSRLSVPSGPGCWPRPARTQKPGPPWRGTWPSWPRRPPPGCIRAPRRYPACGFSTPRKPACATRLPGPWSMTTPWRCGSRLPSPSGGSSGAA